MFKTSTLVALFAVPAMSNCDSCGGGNGGNGGGPVTVDCSAYTPQASEVELTATPRARTDLEQLAIYMDRTFLAQQGTYDLLVGDLGRLAVEFPHTASVRHRAPYAGDQVLVVPDAATLAQIQAGTYTGWACPNDAYAPEIAVQSSYVLLTFPGTFDVPALAAEYAALPGIDSAEPNHLIGGGSTVCATVLSQRFTYFQFDFGSGDCPAGCIEHDYELYLLDDDGNIDLDKQWSNTDGTERPAWVDTYACDY